MFAMFRMSRNVSIATRVFLLSFLIFFVPKGREIDSMRLSFILCLEVEAKIYRESCRFSSSQNPKIAMRMCMFYIISVYND